MARPLALIVNAGSGRGRTTPARGPDALRAAFAQAGLGIEVHALSPGEDMEALLDRALGSNPSGLVAAGGDGTVNAVAARALRQDLPLGVLPLGTLNHFARDLGIPDDLEAAVQVIAAGAERRVDVATANDRVFLNNASIGLYATIVVDRERQQRRLGRGKWSALLRATLAALRDPDAFEAVIEVEGRELRRRTPFLFVGNNDYEVQGTKAGCRARLDDGLLSLYILHPRTSSGLLWLAVRTFLRGTAGDSDLDAFAVQSLVVHARGSQLQVARDGEVDPMEAPVRFAVLPRALRVYAPANEERTG
ncbi:MAG: diacylglycerol kinase family protein [Luteimonas sp.]